MINIEIQFEEQNQISISFYNKEGKRMKLKNDANKSLESEDHSTLKTIHGNQRPHKCDSCDKYFGNKESLVIHIKRVHENVKPFHCEFCDKSFGKKRHLDLHSKTVHGNSKTFNCDYCDKSFGHKNVLNTHTKTIHENTTPYKCESCAKTFAQSNSLKLISVTPATNGSVKAEICFII